MEYNALSSNLEIQNSLSQYKHIKNLIKDDIIYVEGKTDKIFYSQFTKGFHIVCSSEKEKDVQLLVLENMLQGKNIYGIIDPDYSNAKGIPRKIRDKIHVIDANSLETLIVKYSDKSHEPKKAISNFNLIFKKGTFLKNGKREKIYKDAYKYSEITEDVLKWSYYIGTIRKINDSKKYHLNFKLIKEQSNYYHKYIEKNNENTEQKIFNQEEYLKNLCEQSGYDNSFLQKMKKSIEEYNEKKVWDICQGHDIFDFIDCLKQGYSRSDTSKGKMFEKKRSIQIPEWEDNLLKAFDINEFQNSPLQDWFDKINSKVTGNHRLVVKRN